MGVRPVHTPPPVMGDALPEVQARGFSTLPESWPKAIPPQ